MVDATSKDWLGILRREVNRSTAANVARQLGYSRTAISLALNEQYPGGTDRIAKAVIRTFAEKVPCPHLNQELTPDECEHFRRLQMPLSSPDRLRHWHACKTCPLFTDHANDNSRFQEVPFS